MSLARSSSATRPVVYQVIYSLQVGGAERLVSDLATRLDPARFDVRMMLIRDGELRARVEDAGIPVTVSHYRRPNALVPFAELRRLFRRDRPAIVNAHLTPTDMLTRLAALTTGVPVIVSTQHDTLRWPGVVNLYMGATSRMISAVVAGSDAVADHCRKILHVPASKLRVIPNGVDAGLVAGALAPWRSPTTFGVIGRLDAVKGHAHLIEAFSLVRASRPDAKLLIIGEGTERGRLEELVRERGLEGAVEMTGYVDDLAAALSRIDVWVQPSLREGLPLALLDAMAAAKPVIASDIPSLAGLLDHGRFGLLFPPGDPRALADRMLETLASPERAIALGKAGSDLVRERHSIDAMVAGYERLYDELLAKRRR